MMETKISFSRDFSRRMAFLSVGVGLIVCLILPVTYFQMSVQDKKNQAVVRGEVLAKAMEPTVKANLELWYYDVPKFVEIAGSLSGKEGIDAIRIYNEQFQLVYERRIEEPFWLQFMERTPIRYNNRTYGYVEFEYGLDRVTYTVIFLLAGFFLLGLFIAGAIYKYPTSIVGKAEREVREAMKDIEESEARYRAVMEQSPEAIVLVDPDGGEIVAANARFTERFGYSLNQKTVPTLYDLILDEPKIIKQDMEITKTSAALPTQRKLFRHDNGTIVTVERSARVVHYQERQLFMMVLRDVSEEVRREQELLNDAQLAVRVQNTLLKGLPPSEHIKMDIVYQPYRYVGGDLYFLDWRYRGQVLRGLLVDACGHGVSTALHTAALHVLLREVNELDLPLSESMQWLNKRTYEYFEAGSFAGAVCFELDLEARQLRWACAGITEIWVFTEKMKGAIAKPGLFLGILEDECFETHTLPISVGDSIYFMTDGLADIIERFPELPLGSFHDMVAFLQNLSHADECRDDATALCFHVQAFQNEQIYETRWPRFVRFSSYGDYRRLQSEVANIVREVTGNVHSIQEVAVNEALANALECRDGVPRPHQARLRFNKLGDRFIVRVSTSRMGFAGNAILQRLRSQPKDLFSFGEDAPMGRGIPLMLSLSHRMMYNSEGTEVLLAWKLQEMTEPSCFEDEE